MKLVQNLGLRGPWQCQVCRDTDCIHCRSYGPSRVLAVMRGLFGKSFSVALPIQALRGLPCLGSLSVVLLVRAAPLAGVLLCRLEHQGLKGCALGSCSVVQWVRHLMGQPLYGPASSAGMWGKKRLWWWLHPYMWLSSIALFPSLPGFPPQAFPTTISFPFPRSISPWSTAALALGLLQNP